MEKLSDIPHIEPVYYATNGLTYKNIAKFIKLALGDNIELKDFIPNHIKNKYNFSSKEWAISQIHNPSDVLSLKKA